MKADELIFQLMMSATHKQKLLGCYWLMLLLLHNLIMHTYNFMLQLTRAPPLAPLLRERIKLV